jgi:hypothetical protein
MAQTDIQLTIRVFYHASVVKYAETKEYFKN